LSGCHVDPSLACCFALHRGGAVATGESISVRGVGGVMQCKCDRLTDGAGRRRACGKGQGVTIACVLSMQCHFDFLLFSNNLNNFKVIIFLVVRWRLANLLLFCVQST